MTSVRELPRRLLLGPGPSPVAARVLAALAHPPIGHLDPAFLGLMDEIRAGLRLLFATANPMTLALSGTGSAGMEATIVNLVEPGERVLVGVDGVFGGRLAEVARRAGARVETVQAQWGRALDRDRRRRHQVPSSACRRAGACRDVDGLENPVEGLAELVHAHGGLFVLDCVTSLGGMPVEIDAWNVDAAYSATQKCLGCPPGLSPVTFSERAVAKLDRRSTKVASWYLDVSLLRSYWGTERAYHHTAPITCSTHCMKRWRWCTRKACPPDSRATVRPTNNWCASSTGWGWHCSASQTGACRC